MTLNSFPGYKDNADATKVFYEQPKEDDKDLTVSFDKKKNAKRKVVDTTEEFCSNKKDSVSIELHH